MQGENKSLNDCREEKEYELKKRVEIYMPIRLEEQLKKLAEEKSKNNKNQKISKNKLSLMILESYVNGQMNI